MSNTWAYRRETRRGYVARKVRGHRVVAGIVGFVLFASAGALAAWLISGPGEGYGKVGALTAPTTQAIASGDLGGDIFPGADGTMSVKATNPNNVPLFLTGYTVQIVDLPDGVPGCSNTSFSVPNASGLHVGPLAANGTTTLAVPNAIHLDAGAPTECQGARVRVTLSSLDWSTA